METELTKSIRKDLAIELPETISIEELETLLSLYINDLVQNNFQQLVTLLYRLDVSESKLKQMLQQHTDEEAGTIIARLIIERQMQKVKSRQQFHQPDKDIPEEDKW